MSLTTCDIDKILNRLERGDKAIVDQLAAVIEEQIPAYCTDACRTRGEKLRQGLHVALGLFHLVQRDGRKMTATERAAAEQIGVHLAEDGVELADILASVRVAEHVVFARARDLCAAEPGCDIETDDALNVRSLRVTGFINDFSAAVITGHGRHLRSVAPSTESRLIQLSHNVILRGCGPETMVEAVELGIDRRQEIRVVVFAAERLDDPAVTEARTAAQPLLAAHLDAPVRHIALVLDAGPDGEIKPAVHSALATVAKTHSKTLVLSSRCKDLTEVRRAHDEAAAALPFIPLLHEGGGLVESTDLVPATLLTTASPAALATIERVVLAPLRAHRQTEKLLSALDGLIRGHGSPKAASRLTRLPERSVARYKATIGQVTGHYLDDPVGAVWLTAAWAMHRVAASGHIDPITG